MQPSVLVCQCEHAVRIDPAKLRAVFSGLSTAGIAYAAVPDLCGLAATRDPRLKTLAEDRLTRIVACHRRAVQALFRFAGAPLADVKTQVIDLRAGSAADALCAMGLALTPACETDHPPIVEPARTASPNAGQWIPWFPVIDSERCTNCQQCLGFCLFGVYGRAADGKVAVHNPQGCKTNCPACARICPEVAIIFPKYESGSIAGAEITDESREKSRIQADRQSILGSDIYGALAQRRQKVQRRQLLRSEVGLASLERQQQLQPSSEDRLPSGSGTAFPGVTRVGGEPADNPSAP